MYNCTCTVHDLPVIVLPRLTFLSLTLSADDGSSFLSPVTKLMYQVTEVIQCGFEPPADDDSQPADDSTGSCGDIVPDMLCKLIDVLVTMVTHNKEQAERVSG